MLATFKEKLQTRGTVEKKNNRNSDIAFNCVS